MTSSLLKLEACISCQYPWSFKLSAEHEVSVALVQHDHEDLLTSGTFGGLRCCRKNGKKNMKKKNKKRKIQPSRAPHIAAWLIASTRAARDTKIRPAYLPTKFFTSTRAKHFYFSCPLLWPLRYILLHSLYQTVHIISDQTFGEKYVLIFRTFSDNNRLLNAYLSYSIINKKIKANLQFWIEWYEFCKCFKNYWREVIIACTSHFIINKIYF